MKAESARMGKNFLTIDQAIARLIKRTGDDFTWRDLFKKSFNGEIVLHLKIDEVPVRVNLYSEDCVTIECFSGYIDTSLTDDGLEYIKALYNGKEGLGIGSFIDDDQRHYHVADLDELTEDDEFSWMKGLDCSFFKDMQFKFDHVPGGYYKPTYPDTAYEEFYVESFRVDCLIDGINYKNGSGYSFQYVSQLWGYDRRRWGALSDTTEIECIRKGFKQRRDARIFGDSNEPDSSIIQWVVDELDALIKQPDTTIQKILLTVPVTTQETNRFACNPFYHLKIQRRSSQARTRTERLESLKRRFREDFREFLPAVIPPEKLETTGEQHQRSESQQKKRSSQKKQATLDKHAEWQKEFDKMAREKPDNSAEWICDRLVQNKIVRGAQSRTISRVVDKSKLRYSPLSRPKSQEIKITAG